MPPLGNHSHQIEAEEVTQGINSISGEAALADLHGAPIHPLAPDRFHASPDNRDQRIDPGHHRPLPAEVRLIGDLFV